ncbi:MULTISPECIES: DUF397 domain-containing protein [unclassified Streptomyces]|uniref:DUF397 domain-containing protein n=1 Tax=Streptomycetaceae TaxID=2062 RepID=UPI002E768185|nr:MULTISPECIES: DUF397 domain-containing protein [unclassified Streptomyces]MED7952364.1 DUF397 domain-containing protein [Streptomyces sp. BE303]MEE1826537.1 DUF397 domain-containing protein [Streptomyces sp. BE20]
MENDTTPDAEPLHWQKGTLDPDAPVPCLEIAADGDLIRLRESDAPALVVTTSKAKLRAFILGVKAGEFDHLV